MSPIRFLTQEERAEFNLLLRSYVSAIDAGYYKPAERWRNHIDEFLDARTLPEGAPPPGEEGTVTVTEDSYGQAVAVTLQDGDGRILSTLWEREPLATGCAEQSADPLARGALSVSNALDALRRIEQQGEAAPAPDLGPIDAPGVIGGEYRGHKASVMVEFSSSYTALAFYRRIFD